MDCIWVCSFSTTSPSLDQVVLDLDAGDLLEGLGQRLRFVLVGRDAFPTATLISMPLKGSAALMNHSISFSWSSFDRVEGWNSLSIHFLAAASSA